MSVEELLQQGTSQLRDLREFLFETIETVKEMAHEDIDEAFVLNVVSQVDGYARNAHNSVDLALEELPR